MDRQDIKLKLDPLTPTQDPKEAPGSISPPSTSPERPKTPPSPPPRKTTNKTSQNDIPREETEGPSSQNLQNTTPPARTPLATHLTTLPPSYPQASVKRQPLPPFPSHQQSYSSNPNPAFQPPHQSTQNATPHSLPYEFYAPSLPPQPRPQIQQSTLPQEYYAPVLRQTRDPPLPLIPISQTRPFFPFTSGALTSEGRRRYGCTRNCWVLSVVLSLLMAGLVVVLLWYEGRLWW
ncbi:hypothetical protein N431DRAFT_426820 [Stipitochalara longipes BDJ]|nr:hypothetical protein N431DRAFT_426820 [Stipitochalara longipes BDJ]